MTMTNHTDDMMKQVRTYRATVATYEDLRSQINDLLSAHDGGTESMTEADRDRYRDLARRRDEALNDMRWLEQQLLDDNNN